MEIFKKIIFYKTYHISLKITHYLQNWCCVVYVPTDVSLSSIYAFVKPFLIIKGTRYKLDSVIYSKSEFYKHYRVYERLNHETGDWAMEVAFVST